MIRRSVLVAFVAAALVVTPRANAVEAAPTAGTWLVSQFADGNRLLRFPTDPASGDHGLTADGIYALAAAGVGKTTIDQATAWLAAPDQVAYFLGDGEAESYVGGLTKLALVAQVRGEDPKKFAGVDLLARLTAREEASGRFRDLTDPSFDQTNAFTQALAIIVLKRAGLPVEKPVAFEVGTQCPDGGFPIAFDQAGCRSDVDGTAMVLQALLAAGEQTASAKALAWLEKQQQPDGGFVAETANANSTGLAVGALVAGGRTAAADKAVAFLRSLQVGCAGPVAQRGAIAFDAKGFDGGTVVRATTQGMLGLAKKSLADVTVVDATAGVPAIDCAAPPVTVTPPVAPGGPIPQADTPIANTGPEQVVPLTLTGFLAVAMGAALVFIARRRKVGA